MLVERIARWLLAQEPGHRLPRRSQLAHSYQATTAQVDAALAALAHRGLIRETADGHIYRASPAEYLVTFDGLPQAGCRVDPMGSALACVKRNVVHRVLPEEVAHALRVSADDPICAVQSMWSADGTIAALSTTYVPGSPASSPGADPPAGTWPEARLDPVPPPACVPAGAYPGAVRVEVQPPHPRAARSLKIFPSESAVTITVRFDDPATRAPVALTVTVLDPARFHIEMETPGGPSASVSQSGKTAITGAGGSPGAPDKSREQPQILQVNGVCVDLDSHLVHADGRKVILARKEYDLLCTLMQNAGQVVSSRVLLDLVWRPGYIDRNKTLAVHIGRLRRKLDPNAGVSRIRTVRGAGYVFDLPSPLNLDAPPR